MQGYLPYQLMQDFFHQHHFFPRLFSFSNLQTMTIKVHGSFSSTMKQKTLRKEQNAQGVHLTNPKQLQILFFGAQILRKLTIHLLLPMWHFSSSQLFVGFWSLFSHLFETTKELCLRASRPKEFWGKFQGATTKKTEETTKVATKKKVH